MLNFLLVSNKQQFSRLKYYSSGMSTFLHEVRTYLNPENFEHSSWNTRKRITFTETNYSGIESGELVENISATFLTST